MRMTNSYDMPETSLVGSFSRWHTIAVRFLSAEVSRTTTAQRRGYTLRLVERVTHPKTIRGKTTKSFSFFGKKVFLVLVVVVLLLIALSLTIFHTPFPAQRRTSVPVQTMLNSTKEINYFPGNNGWTHMWSRFDPTQIDADFGKIQTVGFNTVRILTQANSGAFDYPSPTPGELHQLAQVITLADDHKLKVHLTLFGLWSQFTDISGSKHWADAVVKPYAGDLRISIIELRNELDPTPNALAWAQAMIPYVKSIDGGIPVTISEYGVPRMQKLVHALQATPPDFWDFHLYNYRGASYAILRDVKALVLTVPLFIGETGYATNPHSTSAFAEGAQNTSAQEAQQEYYFRIVAYAVQGLGLPFASPWIYQDFASNAIPSGAGTQPTQYAFGIYRLDSSAKPAVATLTNLLAGKAIATSFNNGFEQSDGQGLPTLWRIHESDSLGFSANFARDTTVAHSGTASARITQSIGSASGTPCFYLNPVQYVIPGQTYVLSAWAKGLDVTGSNNITIVWLDRSGSPLSTSGSPNFPAGTFDWQQQTLSAIAPSNAAGMELHLNSEGNTGTIWFDDVSFAAPTLSGARPQMLHSTGVITTPFLTLASTYLLFFQALFSWIVFEIGNFTGEGFYKPYRRNGAVSNMFSPLQRTHIISLLLLALLVLAIPFTLLLIKHVQFNPQRTTVSYQLQTVTYCSPGHDPQLMDIYTPANTNNTRVMPLVEMVHGGGWTQGSKSTIRTVQPVPEIPSTLLGLLADGFVVTSINYRLAPQYRFPDSIEDVKCSIRYLRAHAAHYHIDAKRIGLMGASAGGHLASLAALAGPSAGWDVGEYPEQSSTVQAVVDLFGPEYLASGIGNPAMSDPAIFGSDPAMLDLASPPHYIANTPNTDAPFLILQGDKDSTVPPFHSLRFYNDLLTAGQPAILQMVQNAGHEFEPRPAGAKITPSAEQLSSMIVQFFLKHL